MALPLVPDELWEFVQPLLPRLRARPGKRGRPRPPPGALYGDRAYGMPRNQNRFDGTPCSRRGNVAAPSGILPPQSI